VQHTRKQKADGGIAGDTRNRSGPRIDVLGLGCAAVDDILFVSAYPSGDAKVEVRRRERHCGGLTATALVTAARLGVRCGFAGSLGDDEDSRFVLETLRREGVDLRHRVTRDDAGPVRSIIIVDERTHTRNVFFHAARVRGADPHRPSARVIQSARVLLVDRFGIPGMIRAARLARAAGVAVVADLETFRVPRFNELLAVVDHLIVSEEFTRRYTGRRSPASGAEALWTSRRAAVVVTCGARGCWYVDGPGVRAGHLPAFRVKALDTTGCGDVFHGAYAAALAMGAPLVDRLRFASATAAIKATKAGGQAGIPRRAEVERFLRASDGCRTQRL
jgi:sugar/nucleoside kinase (ribokinase family)